MNIYVGNIGLKVQENDLKYIFKNYGEVTSAKIITDKKTGMSRGFGFVVMENLEEAQNAIEDLNGSKINELEIIVNEAKS
jgi:RNA recognition motif-containing protein